MRATLIVTLVLHILSGVFWAGTTFALARTGANQTDQFFRPQMGAAVIVVATGGLLWYLVHPGSFGTTEQILAVGVFCAFVAAWRFAVCPTSRSPLVAKPTTDGVVRAPSALGMMRMSIFPPSLASTTATQELVVPKSIPMIFPTDASADQLTASPPAPEAPADLGLATTTIAGRMSRGPCM